MGRRREARIFALSILYQREIRPDDDVEELIQYTLFFGEYEVEVINYATRVVRTVIRNEDKVDEVITSHADNWTIDRMANLDRNILRMGIVEMLFMGEDNVPVNVAINEAVELAKIYSTEKSGEFVNGILDRVAKDVTRGK
jgi:transcription antitermination factor NusB